MLDAWAWDDKDQQTMQPATKLRKCSSAYLEEGVVHSSFVSEVLSQRLTTKGVRMMKENMLDLSGAMPLLWMEAGMEASHDDRSGPHWGNQLVLST